MGRLQRTHHEPARAAAGRQALGVPGAAALLLAAVLAAGCSSLTGGGDNAAGQSKPGIEGGLEKIASTAGCATPELQDKAGAGFRQGVCSVNDARFTVVSFTNEADKQTWLTEAKQWGGVYLVGPKWVVVSTEPTLKGLQDKLGGDIAPGSGHEGANGGPGTGTSGGTGY